jgi:hypothetical protein
VGRKEETEWKNKATKSGHSLNKSRIPLYTSLFWAVCKTGDTAFVALFPLRFFLFLVNICFAKDQEKEDELSLVLQNNVNQLEARCFVQHFN